MKPDADRNLLFGLLALQSGLVDQDQLVAAFRVWSHERAAPIADVLANRGGLDAEQRVLVDGLVAQHLKRHGGSAERSLAAMDVDRVREDLGRIDASVVESTLGPIGVRRGVGPSPTPVTEDDPDRTTSVSVGSATFGGQRFRVRRPHAQGGLGAVFVALDAELHREVALKQILDSHADDLVSRARFLLEAEITGGLEHPGIVPVYGLGTYDDGRPYYAMRFIRGDSLKEAIDRFHAERSHPKDSGRRSLELRKLLRCFTDVCNAIEYAHGRGVLHRDIKPRNVIVGRHGETLVVDWGLAKVTGQADPASGERTLLPHSSGSSAETVPGSALGTPAYMSPEQAEGDLERLGPRSDIYSLGATLYYLLSGVPPFAGEIADVIHDVQRGAFRPPRQIDAAIDPALEAICLKAMAHQPADRYATPGALVEDIERWAADEPVSAWREPLGRRARRWGRRNRTAVATAAVAVVALLLGTATVLAVQTRANGRLTAANTELAAAKARETARFNLALEAIKLFHGQIDEDLVLKEDRFKPLRDKLLRGAAGFYGQLEGLLRDQPDRASRIALGRAYDELGKLTATIGDQAAALGVYRKALSVWRALASEPGAKAGAQVDVARTVDAIGITLGDTGNAGDALAAYEEARGLLEGLTLTGTIPEAGQSVLGLVEADRSTLLRAMGKTTEAMAASDRSIAVLSRLVDAHPEVAEYRSKLAGGLLTRGYLQTRVGKTEEALESHRRARAMFQKLTEDFPAVMNYRDELGRSDLNIGYTLEALKRLDDAIFSYGQALATFQKLGDDNPAVTIFRRAVPDIHYQMGRALAKIPRPAEALESLGHARVGFQKVVDYDPAVTEARYMLGSCHEVIGDVLRSTGRPAEAMESYRRAVDILQKVVAESPAVPDYRDDLWANHLYLGELLMSMAKPTEAEAEFRVAVAGYRKLVEDNPDNIVFRTYLARSHHGLGGLMRVAGRRDEAMESCGRALELRERLAKEHPSDAEVQSNLGETLNDTALCEMRSGRWKEARELLERAIEHQRQALTLAPRSAAIRERSRDHLRNLVKAYRALEQPTEAVRGARELAELARGNPEELYDAARELSLTVPLTGGEPRQALAALAVATLEHAVAAGWRNAVRTGGDPDLIPLHDRDDFRRLLAELFDRGFPADPIAPRD